MIEAYVRPLYQRIAVDPFAPKILQRFNPNRITLFSCLAGLLVIPALMLKLPLIASLFLLVSGYLDTLDGSMSRLSGKTLPSGAVLDIVSDRIVEFAVILGLFAVDPEHRGLLSLLMLGCSYICVTSFLVVAIFVPNHTSKGFHYSSGIIERAEAFLFFLAMIWLPEYFAMLAVTYSGLVLLTSYLRVKEFFTLFR